MLTLSGGWERGTGYDIKGTFCVQYLLVKHALIQTERAVSNHITNRSPSLLPQFCDPPSRLGPRVNRTKDRNELLNFYTSKDGKACGKCRCRNSSISLKRTMCHGIANVKGLPCVKKEGYS